MTFARASLVLAVAAVTTASCSNSSGTGTAPSAAAAPAALQVSCPVPITAESITGEARSVEFQPASAMGGTAPVSATCAPTSGSMFPVGTTGVKCTAVDAKQQQAACEFNVSVSRSGSLSATRFLAFGDSITFGVDDNICSVQPAGLSIREAIKLDAMLLRPRDNPPPKAYPNQLLQRLAARYPSQSQAISVTNAGKSGEHLTMAEGDAIGTNEDTIVRLRGELTQSAPQVLLLMEGTNDLGSFGHHVESLPSVTKALGDMVREAKSRGAQVFLGTLLPVERGGCRGESRWDMIAPMNDLIRSFATSQGLPLVDLYQAFGGVPGANIGVDGLHPTPQGYDKMAETFFNVIRQRLEVPR